MRIPAIVDQCFDRAIRYLGITDHIHPHTDPRILRDTRLEVARVQGAVEVFLGCEAEVMDVGRHTATDEMVRELDFICVSANHFHLPWIAQPEGESLDAVARHFLRTFSYACSLEFADVIAHPLVVFPGTFDPACLDLLRDDDLMEAIKHAKTNHIAVEISPRALMRDQIDFRLRFYRLCREAGLRFSVGTDAHSLENVGRTQVLAPLVRELDLSDDDIWLPKGRVV